jgi:hypothetical protein
MILHVSQAVARSGGGEVRIEDERVRSRLKQRDA